MKWYLDLDTKDCCEEIDQNEYELSKGDQVIFTITGLLIIAMLILFFQTWGIHIYIIFNLTFKKKTLK